MNMGDWVGFSAIWWGWGWGIGVTVRVAFEICGHWDLCRGLLR